jgi:hypothetical protein
MLILLPVWLICGLVTLPVLLLVASANFQKRNYNASQSSVDKKTVDKLKMIKHNFVVHETGNRVCVVLY